MDISVLGQSSMKVKGKKSSIIINPTPLMQKTDAEAVLFLKESSDEGISKVAGYRIVVKGPGEYEVSGTKISAISVDGQLVALLDVDNVKVLLGEGGSIEKVHDKIENCNIVVVGANDDFNHGFLPSIEPNVVLIYGQNKEQVGKSLGKDSPEKTSKFSASADRLPEDLQVFLLG